MFICIHRPQKYLVSKSSTEIVLFLLGWIESGQVSEIPGSSPASGTWKWLWPSVSSSRNSFNGRHPAFFSGLFTQFINRPAAALFGRHCVSTGRSCESRCTEHAGQWGSYGEPDFSDWTKTLNQENKYLDRSHIHCASWIQRNNRDGTCGISWRRAMCILQIDLWAFGDFLRLASWRLPGVSRIKSPCWDFPLKVMGPVWEKCPHCKSTSK